MNVASLDHLALLDAGFIVGGSEMIAKDSKSYPYLAIAQHYNITYAEVLRFSETNSCKKGGCPYTKWKAEVWMLERDKRK